MYAVGTRVKVVSTFDDELDGVYMGLQGTVVATQTGGWMVAKVALENEDRTHAWFADYELAEVTA